MSSFLKRHFHWHKSRICVSEIICDIKYFWLPQLPVCSQAVKSWWQWQLRRLQAILMNEQRFILRYSGLHSPDIISKYLQLSRHYVSRRLRHQRHSCVALFTYDTPFRTVRQRHKLGSVTIHFVFQDSTKWHEFYYISFCRKYARFSMCASWS